LPNGARAYGYSPDGLTIIAREAAIVREIFDRFCEGETPFSIAADLSRRGSKTAKGGAWTEATVRRQLRNKHVAGICWHKGHEVAMGKWLPIIPRTQWDFAQELLTFRSAAAQKQQREKAAYLRPTWAGDLRELWNHHGGLQWERVPMLARQPPRTGRNARGP
jgi:Recombinase